MEQLLKNKILKEALEWIICFVIAYFIYIVLNFFVGTIAGIKQTSMYPTAKEGEKVVIGRRILFNKTLNRGDIVTLEAPVDVQKSEQDIYARYVEREGLDWFVYNILEWGKKSYIKRIIALGGDTLEITEQGNVVLNGEILQESYLKEGLETPRNGNYYSLTIPQGYVFVMGDNRTGSKDSRAFGVIPEDKIHGKVACRIWPLNQIGEI